MSHGPSASGGAMVAVAPRATHDDMPYVPVFTGERRVELDAILSRYPSKQAALLPALWMVQDVYGWVSEAAMEARCFGCPSRSCPYRNHRTPRRKQAGDLSAKKAVRPGEQHLWIPDTHSAARADGPPTDFREISRPIKRTIATAARLCSTVATNNVEKSPDMQRNMKPTRSA